MLQEKYTEVYKKETELRTKKLQTIPQLAVNRESFNYSSHNTICGVVVPFVCL